MREVKIFEVYMWIDDHVNIIVLAENEEEARVRAKASIEQYLGKDVSHGIITVDEFHATTKEV